MDYSRLMEINSKLKTVDIKGKEYVEVNKRVLAFRELYPEGCISTEIESLGDGMCVVKANIYKDDERELLATGIAYEKEGSSFINKTSYVENAETSAVGRALGFLGIGIDTSIASAEEVQNAVRQQNETKVQSIKVDEKERPNLVNEIGDIISAKKLSATLVYKKIGVENLNALATERMPGMIEWLNGMKEADLKKLREEK